MPKRVQRFNYQKTKDLEELRDQADIKIEEMAEFFRLDRDAVRDWELGYRSPHKTRRLDFIVYLLDKLRLRRDHKRFLQIWNDVIVEEWEWKPLSREELWQYLPNKVKDITPTKPAVPPFLAPPLPPYELVGRKDMLITLKEQLFAGGTLALSALNGLPGVGKTALAVALAHDREVLEHFRDGVLWAGLGRQGDAFALLGSWALELDIPRDELAKLTTVEARAKAIHAKIGMRHLLLVVDDAWQSEAALAFKVGGANCAHLVTTRKAEVAIYFAGQGVTVVHELNETDGLVLLGRLAPKVTADEPEAAVELVSAIGGLPLGLILIGNYLNVQAFSGRLIEAALIRLQKKEERLRLPQPQSPLESHPSLSPGADISLQAIIAVSDEALDETSRRILRTLSVFPSKPNTFSEEAALAVSTASFEAIGTLCNSGLLEISELGRYTLHQTIADFASLQFTDEFVFERMVRFFVEYSEIHETDYAKLDLEKNNVLAALKLALERGMQAFLIRGTNAFYNFLETRGLFDLADSYLIHAEQAARDSRDGAGLATVLYNLGRIVERRGNYAEAAKFYQQGLAVARQVGHRERVSALLQGLGAVSWYLGDYAHAEEYLREGLDLARTIKDNERVSYLLLNLGLVASNRGDNLQAEKYWLEGLTIARQFGYSRRISDLLTNLGALSNDRGDYAQSEAYLQEGLTIARKIGYNENICSLLANLGVMTLGRGDYEQAEEFYQEGLALARKMEYRGRISNFLVNLGEVVSKRGDYAQAETYFKESLDLARQIGYRWLISAILFECGEHYLRQQNWDKASIAFLESLEIAKAVNTQEFVATALFGLARVAAAKNNTTEARQQSQQSLVILQAIGHHKVDEVKQWLDSLPPVDTRTEQDHRKEY